VNRESINQYERGGALLHSAVAGLGREKLLARPADGSWSIQQIVIHLLDSELVFADRMKRVIAEENPPLIGYDQSRFAQNLFYDEQSVEDAVAIVELNRRNMTRILRRLPEAAFSRIGTHNERGPTTLEQLLTGATEHLEHHLRFIEKKRPRN
jgi:uncharacterized damage-inducible protein DinB